MTAISEFITFISPYLPVLAWVSALTFLLSLFVVPILLAKIPADYFLAPDIPGTKTASIHYSLIWLVRNIVGLTFIFAGIAMLVLPGQGLLTIFLGLFIADFPGKRTLEKRLVSVPTIYKTINWIRKKKGVDQLLRP